jgi:hypothetical protein
MKMKISIVLLFSLAPRVYNRPSALFAVAPDTDNPLLDLFAVALFALLLVSAPQ